MSVEIDLMQILEFLSLDFQKNVSCAKNCVSRVEYNVVAFFESLPNHNTCFFRYPPPNSQLKIICGSRCTETQGGFVVDTEKKTSDMHSGGQTI